MIIARTIEIDMGHRIPNHATKCRNLHGHRYRFELGIDDDIVETKGDSGEGMVLDFGLVKDVMVRVIDVPLDHGLMLSEVDPLIDTFAKDPTLSTLKLVVSKYVPTVENIARDIYLRLKRELEAINVQIEYLKVWETPNCFAIFSRECE